MTALSELAIYWNSPFKMKAVLRPFCHTRGASATGRISLAKLRTRIIKLGEIEETDKCFLLHLIPGGFLLSPSVSTSLPHLDYIFFKSWQILILISIQFNVVFFPLQK